MRTAVLAALALALGACTGGGDDARTLPDVTLESITEPGRTLRLADLRGPAVVNLWATWCAPCRQELPAFQQVSEERPDVRFVGVDVAEDAATAGEFLAELGITFEQYLDDRGELPDALGAVGLPVTVVVDAAGRIAVEHLGPMSVEDLDEAIARAAG